MKLINNTNTDIRGMVENAVWAAIKTGTALPEELADLFNLVAVGPGVWRLDWF